MRSPIVLLRVVAAGWLVFIVYATLSGLSSRPSLAESETDLITAVERFGAYGVLGFLARLSFPSRPGLVSTLILVLAAALELAQFLVPDRDPRLIDALEKGLGGMTGFVIPTLAARLFRWRGDPAPRRPADSPISDPSETP